MGLWCGILLLHVPAAVALVTSIVSEESSVNLATAVPRMLGMVSSCLLFAFKAADVEWLRIPPTRRNIFIATLVLGFIHLGALEKTRTGALEASPLVMGWVIVCGATAAVDTEVVGRVLRLAHRLFSKRSVISCRMYSLAWVRLNRPSRPAYIYGFGSLRAPPLA